MDQPSEAPLKEFYMYRVQGDENYPHPNHDLANLAGAMWYLQNEIVWHKDGRYGTFFSTPVTRILKLRVQTRVTQPLFNLGMNFGVMNTFDSGECTGPWDCDNFPKYGYTVGCETWQKGAPSNFPHQQWDDLNHYHDAVWYSLPGSCPSHTYKTKTKQCIQKAPGGECPEGVEPTGTWNCTYRLNQVGELSINALEGIKDYKTFIADGGVEYDAKTDKGVHLSFWNGIKSDTACAKRVQIAEQKFKEKYPDQVELPGPTCDFNRFKFYPDRDTR